MVEVIEVNPKAPSAGAIGRAVKVIKEGGLVIYPTETVYGLGGDASSDEVVARVFKAKSRSLENPILVAVSSFKMASKVVKMNTRAEKLFQKFMSGPLSIILKVRSNLSKLVSAGTGRVGIRIPNHSVALKLVEEVGRPITSTSANISGRPAPSTAQNALDQLSDHVDLVLDSGRTPFREPSTVVDAADKKLNVIREGPISAEEIKAELD